jgi:Tol biopolymer transport system component
MLHSAAWSKRASLLRVSLVAAAALLVALLLALVGTGKPAGAAFPGQNGRIAYVVPGSYPADDEIYSMKPDGTDRKQLTYNTANDYAPDISPDGTEVAFVSLRSGVNKVYVMNADGTEVKNLSGSFTGDETPTWSPDGKKIAFVRRADIWVMNADGSGRKNVTNTGPVNGYSVSEEGPSWSPDGTKVAFYKTTCRPCDVDLYTINAGGTGLKQLTDYASKEYTPDWSPSGHRIAFYSYSTVAGMRIFTIRPDGTSNRIIASNGETPVWSPDGKGIAFTREGDLYKVISDGSGAPSKIAGPAESREWTPNWGPMPPTAG